MRIHLSITLKDRISMGINSLHGPAEQAVTWGCKYSSLLSCMGWFGLMINIWFEVSIFIHLYLYFVQQISQLPPICTSIDTSSGDYEWTDIPLDMESSSMHLHSRKPGRLTFKATKPITNKSSSSNAYKNLYIHQSMYNGQVKNLLMSYPLFP